MPVSVCAQNVGLKTNFIYDASTTPNLALEFATSRKTTWQAQYSLNLWDEDLWKGKETYIKHWMGVAEWRWWHCQTFNGFYLGLYGRGGEFDLNNVEGVFGIPKAFQKGKREEGWFAGGGLTLGYEWLLSKHWNFELGLTVGADYIQYDRYQCGDCGTLEATGNTYYYGLTSAVLSLIYMF